MKCKAKGCCVCAYSASGYCDKHLYMIRTNKINDRKFSLVCNKKGCKNIVQKGKLYCSVHDLSISKTGVNNATKDPKSM